MKWSLMELRKYQDSPLYFDQTLELEAELLQRNNQILAAGPVTVSGWVNVEDNDYLLHYTLDVVLTLPSSRSLTAVDLPMHFSVDEVFMTQQQFEQRDENIAAEEVLILTTQTLDLNDSVVDNILLEIPMQILTDEEKKSGDFPSGDGWEVISEEEYHKQKADQELTNDPRLADLSDLLDDSKEDKK
ncbi:MAG TPA: YceD family protein [Tetragenococcus sp.]|nr:YceD family protein [Tetragenococcus sp.]